MILKKKEKHTTTKSKYEAGIKNYTQNKLTNLSYKL